MADSSLLKLEPQPESVIRVREMLLIVDAVVPAPDTASTAVFSTDISLSALKTRLITGDGHVCHGLDTELAFHRNGLGVVVEGISPAGGLSFDDAGIGAVLA